jgi:ribosomal protein S18 acetylase RimI-like enzyme
MDAIAMKASSDLQIDNLSASEMPRIVRIHSAAFPRSSLTRLGEEAVRRYYDWQFRGPHELSALGAWVDGMLMGYCLGGVFQAAMGGYLRSNRTFILSRVVLRPWLLLDRTIRGRLFVGLHAMRPFAGTRKQRGTTVHSTKKSFSVLAIAVHPRCRRRGVGAELMRRIEEHARHSGFDSMELTVNPINKSALAFYERCGWKTVSHSSEAGGSCLLTKSIKTYLG